MTLRHYFRFVSLAPLLLLLLGCGTGEGKTTLRAQFASEPTGGEFVQELAADIRFDRKFKDQSGILQSAPSPEDITVTVQWVGGDEVFETSRTTITDDQSTYRASISTSGDTYFVGEWFVRVRWTDDNGTQRIESSTAFCTPPDNASGTDERDPTITLPSQATD